MPVLPQGRHVQGSLLVQLKRAGRPGRAVAGPPDRHGHLGPGAVHQAGMLARPVPEPLPRPGRAQALRGLGAVASFGAGRAWRSSRCVAERHLLVQLELQKQAHFIPMHETRFWCQPSPKPDPDWPQGLACTQLMGWRDLQPGCRWVSLRPLTGQKHRLQSPAERQRHADRERPHLPGAAAFLTRRSTRPPLACWPPSWASPTLGMDCAEAGKAA